MINKEDRNRILKLLVAVLFILSFFLVNARQYAYAFLIYIVMGILSVLFYLVWDKISKKSDLEGLGKHWIRNSFIGLGLAVVTMVAGTIIPGLGVIGTPSLSQSVVQLIGVLGSFMVIVVSASLFEGIFIINALTDFFENFLGLNKHFAISLMAVVGSFFHLTSYGLVASGGSFLSAFIMFFLFGELNEYQNDSSGQIAWHGGINWWLEFGRKMFGG